MWISTEEYFKLTDLQDALLLSNGSLKNYLTLTMQNIDFTEETKAQFISNKKKIKKKYQQAAEEKKIGIDPECT